MNNYKFKTWGRALTLSALSFFTLTCTDLEPELVGETEGEELLEQLADNLRTDPENTAFSLIGGIYNTVDNFNPQDGVWALGAHTSDETQGPTRGTDWDDGGIWRVLHTHEWDPFHRMVGNAWSSMNQGTARAYASIGLFENAGATEVPAVQRAIAESRALRAFFMYNVVDLFGQVPALDAEGNPIVLQRAEATDYIISELEAVASELPDRDEISQAQYFRWDKAAAYGLLAKVYINRGVFSGSGFQNSDLQKVVENVDRVAAQGYELTDDYWQLFALDNGQNAEAQKEIIITVDNSDVQNAVCCSHSRVMMTLHYNMNFGRPEFEPWNGFTTIADFYNRWDADGDLDNGVDTDDNRFRDDRYFDETAVNNGFLVGQQYDVQGDPLTDRNGNPLVLTVDVPLFGANERQGVRVIKYPPDTDTPDAGRSDSDIIVLRYGDLHLLKAEALWRLGNTSEALDLINELRSKRGADEISSIDGDGTEILNERGYELYWEGHRRQDLIRFGRFLDDWTNKGGTSEEFRQLFPIPQNDIDINPNLVQNPGYAGG